MSGLKGFIRLDGSLIIERNDKNKEQFCPYSEFSNRCGDWCPLFQPQKDLTSETSRGTITLCNGVVLDFAEIRRLDRE